MVAPGSARRISARASTVAGAMKRRSPSPITSVASSFRAFSRASVVGSRGLDRVGARIGGEALLHRADDRGVAGAAAEIAGERVVDRLLAGQRVGRAGQGEHRHDEAGRAEAALRAVAVDHRLLHRVQPPVGALEVLDGEQLAAVEGRHELDAGVDGAVVEPRTFGLATTTVQAPQSPSLQPSLVPVRRRASRSQSSTVWVGSTRSSSTSSWPRRKRTLSRMGFIVRLWPSGSSVSCRDRSNRRRARPAAAHGSAVAASAMPKRSGTRSRNGGSDSCTPPARR